MTSVILPPHSHAASNRSRIKELQTPWHWTEWEVPNVSDWRRGDIILVEAPSPSSIVRIAQASSSNPLMQQGSDWTHAGVYVGEGYMVDAMYPIGVARQSVWQYCQSRALRVRRLPGHVPPANIDKIATLADSYVGNPYATWQAIFAGLGFTSSKPPTPDAIYCSTLVALAVTQATALALGFPRHCQPILPAVLAVHPWLTDVQLEWRDAV